jgi:hypothetical protein
MTSPGKWDRFCGSSVMAMTPIESAPYEGPPTGLHLSPRSSPRVSGVGTIDVLTRP